MLFDPRIGTDSSRSDDTIEKCIDCQLVIFTVILTMVYIYTHTHTHTHTHKHTVTYIYFLFCCKFIYVCLCVCVFVFVYTLIPHGTHLERQQQSMNNIFSDGSKFSCAAARGAGIEVQA